MYNSALVFCYLIVIIVNMDIQFVIKLLSDRFYDFHMSLLSCCSVRWFDNVL